MITAILTGVFLVGSFGVAVYVAFVTTVLERLVNGKKNTAVSNNNSPNNNGH
jgi:hypothetical protein